MHAGKTQIWKNSGRCPPGCEGIFEAARVADPNAVVWKGDQSLPTDRQGVVILGAPIGHAHFVARELQAKTEEHSVLFRRILAVPDLQCAWLLLLFCAATRANYFLRVVQPAWAERFAFTHDENVWNCTQELLDIEGTVRVRQLSSLPLAFGGLGPRSAIRSQNAASWASWADSLPRIRERHPKHCGPHQRRLVPRDIPRTAVSRDPTEPRFGWQCLASEDVERTYTVPYGLSSHKQTEHSLGPSVVICWHSVHLLTNDGRVTSGTSDFQGSVASSPLVPPSSLYSLLPVRPSP